MVPLLQIPNNCEEWKTISDDFNVLWNFPNCIGAMDGKHVLLQAPFNSGAEFFNYKSTYSIVLFALVDANYNILYVDAGCQGRISDGGVFKNSKLHEMIENNELQLPAPIHLNGRTKKLPYFILADSAFAMSESVMKPYPGQNHPKGSKERIFNYRLSRARRVVENVFGIMSSTFRVLRKPMLLEPDKATVVVMAIVHLHNFLRRPSSRNFYMPRHYVDSENEDGQLIEGTWRLDHDMTSFYPIRNVARRSTAEVKGLRNELADYFMAEGRIAWQDKYS